MTKNRVISGCALQFNTVAIDVVLVVIKFQHGKWLGGMVFFMLTEILVRVNYFYAEIGM